MKRLFLCLSLLVAPSWVGAEDSDHLSEIDGVRVLHAWTWAHQSGTVDVYLEIENESGADARLVGGDAHDVAEGLDILANPTTAGADPVPLPELIIPAGADLILDENGVFIRLTSFASETEEGDEFEIHLEFAGLGELEVHVEVEAEDAKQHSHAGHNH